MKPQNSLGVDFFFSFFAQKPPHAAFALGYTGAVSLELVKLETSNLVSKQIDLGKSHLMGDEIPAKGRGQGQEPNC